MYTRQKKNWVFQNILFDVAAEINAYVKCRKRCTIMADYWRYSIILTTSILRIPLNCMSVEYYQLFHNCTEYLATLELMWFDASDSDVMPPLIGLKHLTMGVSASHARPRISNFWSCKLDQTDRREWMDDIRRSTALKRSDSADWTMWKMAT